MTHQFRLRIAGGAQGADDSGFPRNRIVNRDDKDKSDDHDHDIEQDQHHSPVAAHVLSGELDRLIDIARHKILQIDLLCDILHQLIGQLFLLLG